MSTQESTAPTVQLPQFIDDRPVTRLQYGVLGLCGIVMFLDGFDTQAISYVAPAIAEEWGIPTAALGPIFSSALVGLMIGYLLLSPLSNHLGNKRVIVIATTMFSVFSLATLLVQDVTQLIALRFLTGLGLGATAPSAIALTSEYAPRRLRATFVLVIYCGFSLGFVASGLAAGTLIPAFGWRSMFLLGGIVPLVLVPVLLRFLPESLDFMISKNSTSSRVSATLRRLDPHLAPGTTATTTAAAGASAPRRALRHLFSRRWILGTVLLWIVFAINLAEFYALVSWMPTMLTNLDYANNVVVAATTLITVGGIAAAFVTGPSMDRLGAYGTLGTLYLIGFLFVALIGFALHSTLWLLLAATFLAGCCVSGGQKSAIALSTLFYPASLRSIGAGWALGVGRVGGILGPIAVGGALGLGWDASTVFYTMAIPMLAAGILVLLLGRTYGRKSTVRDSATST